MRWHCGGCTIAGDGMIVCRLRCGGCTARAAAPVPARSFVPASRSPASSRTRSSRRTRISAHGGRWCRGIGREPGNRRRTHSAASSSQLSRRSARNDADGVRSGSSDDGDSRHSAAHGRARRHTVASFIVRSKARGSKGLGKKVAPGGMSDARNRCAPEAINSSVGGKRSRM